MSRSARVAALAFTALAVADGAGAGARAEIFGSTYRSPIYGVEMTVPRGWELSEQSSYPGILARAYEHTSHARITLAVQAVAPTESLKGYLDRNVKSLKRLKYDVLPPASRGGVLILEARTPDKKQVVRQAYIGRTGAVFILSFATEQAAASTSVRLFEETLRSLTFVAAPSAPNATPAADAPPPGAAPTPSPSPP